MKQTLRLLTILALSIVVITGCGAGDSTPEEDLEERQGEEAVEEQEPDEAMEEEQEQEEEGTIEAQMDEEVVDVRNYGLTNNDDLEQMISTENGIERVVIEVAPGEYRRVLVDIEVDEDRAAAPGLVADTYSGVIKERYPDHLVDIIVTQDGALLTQVTY